MVMTIGLDSDWTGLHYIEIPTKSLVVVVVLSILYNLFSIASSLSYHMTVEKKRRAIIINYLQAFARFKSFLYIKSFYTSERRLLMTMATKYTLYYSNILCIKRTLTTNFIVKRLVKLRRRNVERCGKTVE